jgi:hypothetical protein
MLHISYETMIYKKMFFEFFLHSVKNQVFTFLKALPHFTLYRAGSHKACLRKRLI